MIIFKSGFILLEYEPATDILSFEMPNVDNVHMPEMKRSLGIVVEHVRNYDVKNLLVDARRTDFWVEEETYATIITSYYRHLSSTRLQKVARIVKPSSEREKIMSQIFEKNEFPLHVQQFTEPAPATEWLKG